ncbi:hypothetical protein KW797_00220 [Candidatus Parcubacteria bacterium]|nr:hypothetical protein [Candidatus Parcubacteria bacterium]
MSAIPEYRRILIGIDKADRARAELVNLQTLLSGSFTPSEAQFIRDTVSSLTDLTNALRLRCRHLEAAIAKK